MKRRQAQASFGWSWDDGRIAYIMKMDRKTLKQMQARKKTLERRRRKHAINFKRLQSSFAGLILPMSKLDEIVRHVHTVFSGFIRSFKEDDYDTVS